MNAINTLVLKLIICSACTCITGEGVSAYVVEFTGFSISRWGVFLLVHWLYFKFKRLQSFFFFFHSKYKYQPVVLIFNMFLNVSCFQEQVKEKECCWFYEKKKYWFWTIVLFWVKFGVRFWSNIWQKMTLCIGRKDNDLPCSKKKAIKQKENLFFWPAVAHLCTLHCFCCTGTVLEQELQMATVRACLLPVHTGPSKFAPCN